MSLKQRLGQAEILLAPGVYDALTGLIAEQSGAEAVYLSSIHRLHAVRPTRYRIGVDERGG